MVKQWGIRPYRIRSGGDGPVTKFLYAFNNYYVSRGSYQWLWLAVWPFQLHFLRRKQIRLSPICIRFLDLNAIVPLTHIKPVVLKWTLPIFEHFTDSASMRFPINRWKGVSASRVTLINLKSQEQFSEYLEQPMNYELSEGRNS